MLDAIPQPQPSHVRPILVGHARAPVAPAVEDDAGPRPTWLGDAPLGLDRRGGPRDATEAQVDRFTARSHRPLPLVFGLRTGHAHALLKGLSFSPRGVLLHLLDILDPELDAHERLGALGLTQLARAVGSRGHSPLGLLTACMEARSHVADLSRRANATANVAAARGSWPSCTVELVALLRLGHDRAEALAPLRVRGVLAPLADPSPAVLAVALPETALAQVEALLASSHGAEPRILTSVEPTSQAADAPAPTIAGSPDDARVGSPPGRHAGAKPRTKGRAGRRARR